MKPTGPVDVFTVGRAFNKATIVAETVGDVSKRAFFTKVSTSVTPILRDYKTLRIVPTAFLMVAMSASGGMEVIILASNRMVKY